MPKPPRFFISPEQVVGSRIIVSVEDVHHITTVLRMKAGEMLILSDGKGTEYTVKIAQVNGTEIATEIVNESRRQIPYPRVTLGQGLPKSDKMDWIVQKATELGVWNIVPLITERTIVKVGDEKKRIVRWRKICREAAMQSNRVDIPAIGHILSFKDFLRTSNFEPGTLFLLPWEEGTTPIKDALHGKSDVNDIIVLIGPEGGFTTAEVEMAKGKGFHLVSLGPNILRTETAAVAVLSMIGYEYR